VTELEQLLVDLVAIDSVNPSLVPGGAGEADVAAFIAAWFEDRDVATTMHEVAPGRPNVVARVGDGGRTLLLLAHTDTVGAGGMAGSPRARDGRLTGRGAYDMKAGLAAAMSAAVALKDADGQVIVAAVCDEECAGLGTRALLAGRERFDAAIVTEPTDLDIAIAHKGFVGFTFETAGRAAHGSRPDLGIDAITAIGPALVALGELDGRMQAGPRHPLLGPPSLHASLITGGQEASTYPASCLVTGECRTIPGVDAVAQLRAALDDIPGELRITFSGEPFEIGSDSEIVRLLRDCSGSPLAGADYWADSALLARAGIPTVLLGPAGGGAHADDEWVDLASVERVRDVLVTTARKFFAIAPA
jgi:acetylornithine deacetylase